MAKIEQKTKNFLGFDLTKPEGAKKLEQYVYEQVKAGKLVKEALGFSASTEEHLYSMAYGLYNQGRYVDGLRIFGLLVFLDYKSFRYQFGFSACMQMLEEYQKAIDGYIRAIRLEPTNPMPDFYLAECYTKLRMPKEAKKALEMTIKKSSQKKEYASIAARAEMMLKNK